MNAVNYVENIRWTSSKTIILLDQTKLPLKEEYVEISNLKDVWKAIETLQVRGAPAIGVAGAYGLLVGLSEHRNLSGEKLYTKASEIADYINSSRPTAVNLSWGLKLMLKEMEDKNLSFDDAFSLLERKAISIHEEDKKLCEQIGLNGEGLIKDGMSVLTHCNAGSLATGGMGTALAPIYMAHAKGKKVKVFADETRPLLQGSRLTTWELTRAGIETSLICDNMAASLMQAGKIDFIIVGADRVALNGDVANKIGTLSVAINAKYFGIPFYVACPYSTLDFQTKTGKEIVIEQRNEQEVKSFHGVPSAPVNVTCENPAFDVTPANLVSGIITEKGVFKFPYQEKFEEYVNG